MSSTPDKPPTTIARVNQPPTVALLAYPATLIIGSLFSVLSPTAHGSRDHAIDHTGPLAPTIAADLNLAHQPPVNYFARKDNIFNVYFVKVGWLWTTLAFSLLVFSLPAYTTPSSQRPRRIGQAVARYALATLVWYSTTQWFVGPAIIDRSFVLTGGKCEHVVPLAEGEEPSLHTLFTAAACKSAGGSWRGGHDVSGHVFMLVLTTSMLVFETIGALASENGAVKSENGLKTVAVRFAWVVSGLGWWMLLMTAIWFHTWFEKVCIFPLMVLLTGFSGLTGE